MARIGFRKAKYNQIDGDTYKALEGAKVPEFEKVIDEAFAGEYNTAELYANDGLAESDYSFNKGTLTINIADDNDEFLAGLFGNKITEGEVTSTIDDTAPEFGYGHIIPKMVKGVREYKVEFFPRVKFTKVTSDNKSRSASVEFSTSSLEGTVFPLETALNGVSAGTWEKHQTFATLEEAEAYLDKLLTPTV
jgi:phi13 family phage major tail protein